MPVDPCSELESWLILVRAPGVGAVTLRALIGRHGTAAAALHAARRGGLARDGSGAGEAWLRAPDATTIAADIAWLAEPGHALLTFDQPDFPPLLDPTPGAPAALFVVGDVGALYLPQVAIVGSRNATQGGVAHARDFATALATAGFTITSGLALGIDGAAHAAALDAGAATIAVLGTGPDLVYPQAHRELAARIGGRGALVSEFPPGTLGHPSHFPRRNRIIAGLSLATLVIEAGARSGSLITAGNAAEAGREVFALPGSIHNPLARGCHQLIRSGARLVESADEIVAELAPLALRMGVELRARLDSDSDPTRAEPTRVDPKPGTVRALPRDAATASVLEAIAHDPVGIDQLASRTGFDPAQLASILLELELGDEIFAVAGGSYARRR